MITAIKALLNRKSNKIEEKVFLESNEILYHLGRATCLLTEMKEGFFLEHIVETFWLTTDLFDAIKSKDNLTEAEQNLLESVRNWSRNQYGFCRAEPAMPCSAKNIYIGGDLGYNTGLLPFNSLQGLHTLTIEEYCNSEYYEHLSRTYEKLFLAIVSQFIDLLTDLKKEPKN